MSDFANRSRRLARERYWNEHDRNGYQCPDCGRTEDEIVDTFQVHHKSGTPFDNREEALIALCGLCHRLREGKKPSLKRIKALREGCNGNSESAYSELALSFVDEYVCQCAEGIGYEWGDNWSVWVDFFEDHAESRGAEIDMDAQHELAELFDEMPRCRTIQHTGGVDIIGPAPSQCGKDCFTRSDITASSLNEVSYYDD